jgi:hypothetical protein
METIAESGASTTCPPSMQDPARHWIPLRKAAPLQLDVARLKIRTQHAEALRNHARRQVASNVTERSCRAACHDNGNGSKHEGPAHRDQHRAPASLADRHGRHDHKSAGYLYQVWSLSCLTTTLAMPRSMALNATMISAAIAARSSLFFGWLADRIGWPGAR